MTGLRVVAAGPLVSLQDAGRPGNMRFGVPASGPMDRVAHAAANLAVGNEASATAIEVSVAGVTLEVDSGAVTLAVTGGQLAFEAGSAASAPLSWCAVTLEQGARVTVRPSPRRSWAYVAVAAVLDVPLWLGHTATHSMSGFGGGALRAGQSLTLVDVRVDRSRDGEIPMPDDELADDAVRVVVGPQERHFHDRALEAFTSSPYTLTDAYDRMGVRLDGPLLELRQALSIPSEPIVRGSVQVTGDGVPAVLLADHQTTGGYPKIATVISSDVGRLAQRRPGDSVRFLPIASDEAVRVVRADARRTAEYLAVVGGEGRTLTHRLRTANLVGDVAPPADT